MAAAEPQLTASEAGLILSWIERRSSTTTLKFAERTGSGWSEPITVASGGNWSLSAADPPTVLRRPDGMLIANWLVSTNPKYEGSDLYLSYSADAGRTWAKPFTPHHDGTDQQHAFPSFFELPEKGLGVMWLDGRDSQPTEADPGGGAMALRYATYDGRWTRIAEGVVDARVCECCSTAAAVTSEGVLIAFRDRSDQEIRDIAVSRFQNGKWSDSARVHEDNWELDACPVNGPSVSAAGRDAVVAWYTVKEAKGQAFAAFSHDAGRTWGNPIRLDEGSSLGQVGAHLLDDGSAIATWVEFVNSRREYRMRRIEPSGEKSVAATIAGAGAGRLSGVPRAARLGDELVFAWTESAQDSSDGDTMMTIHTATANLARTGDVRTSPR
jgi:hypothetical protein